MYMLDILVPSYLLMHVLDILVPFEIPHKYPIHTLKDVQFAKKWRF